MKSAAKIQQFLEIYAINCKKNAKFLTFCNRLHFYWTQTQFYLKMSNN